MTEPGGCEAFGHCNPLRQADSTAKDMQTATGTSAEHQKVKSPHKMGERGRGKKSRGFDGKRDEVQKAFAGCKIPNQTG